MIQYEVKSLLANTVPSEDWDLDPSPVGINDVYQFGVTSRLDNRRHSLHSG